ncbi:MAG: short-chain dehydrogenase/reductase [Rhodovarius sp.]|nr:short-chain dehydrogenase/reductase [Rhodovarius sp.]MDW8315074.1 short-chain dehydrogenase/reductase [Rhodovarius sp.]
MDMQLAGRKVVITGGSKGIGLACAEAFAAEGAAIVISARDQERLAAAASGLSARFQVPVEAVPADLSRPEERVRLHALHGDADILINNAGAIPAGTLAEIDLARWQAAWDLKVFGYIHLCQLFLPAMAARRAGVIVNIIGMAGRAPRAHYIAGAAGNAALIAFTQALGAASVASGVRVLGINPGVTATDRMEAQARARAARELGDAERWRELLADLPFGRPIAPREIAELAVFAASPRASYLSGTVIDVDGGAMHRA